VISRRRFLLVSATTVAAFAAAQVPGRTIPSPALLRAGEIIQ
jgi:hypothetical protein